MNKQIANQWIKETLLNYPEISFKWSRERVTKLGDYRFCQSPMRHIITLNNNMQPMATWVVFLHELAHYIVKVKYSRVAPHGKEWKYEFRKLLEKEILEKDWEEEELLLLKKIWRKPNTKLTKVEITGASSGVTVQEIGKHPFMVKNRGPFVVVRKRRTRYLIKELSTNKEYLVHQDAEVQKHL